MSSVRDAIASLEEEIREITSQNAAVGADCRKLEQEFESVTRGLSRNVDLLRGSIQVIKEENVDLMAELRRRESLMEEIRPLFCKFANSKFSDGFDVFGLSRVFGALPKTSEISEELDPILEQCVSTVPYFKGCSTKSAFYDKLKRMMMARSAIGGRENELRRLRMESDRNALEYVRKLNAVGSEQIRLCASLEREAEKWEDFDDSRQSSIELSPGRPASKPKPISSPLHF
jgi:hypothetical protein